MGKEADERDVMADTLDAIRDMLGRIHPGLTTGQLEIRLEWMRNRLNIGLLEVKMLREDGE